MTEYVKISKDEYLKLKLVTQRDYYNYTNGYQDCLNHDSKTIKELKEWLEEEIKELENFLDDDFVEQPNIEPNEQAKFVMYKIFLERLG